MNNMTRALLFLFTLVGGKGVKSMLIRLYASEIISEKISEDSVPATLKERVHQYLVDLGYYAE